MKKILILTVALLLLVCGCKSDKITLPKPELEEGMRGQLGIDKNVNEKTIDKYLNMDDAVYRDVRMLVDVAKYENIGGDSYLSGYVKGFEVVPFPYLAPVVGLPDAVGKAYSGKTLYSIDKDGNYTANYKESLSILESLFPKDKTIFIMCGGGGYAGMTKTLLVSLGWDENKIHNVGGFWYYEGENKVNVKREDGSYNFAVVPYHNIDFTTLTAVKK